MVNKFKLMTGAEAIRSGFVLASKKIKDILLISEGIDDPSSFYGTTKDLNNWYNKKQIIEMPLSESALTGISIGAAINGMRPILNFHRVEFALLAMEQIFNNAAKASFLSDGKHKVPFVLRMVIGRGWGQGPAHSQSLENVFASVPGLKIVMPTFPSDTKRLLLGSIIDNNPVLILEHRWCHYLTEKVETGYHFEKLNTGPKKLSSGNHYSIISTSYGTVEALQAVKILKKYKIFVELFDLRIVRPLVLNKIFKSVKKTGRLITIDTGFKFLGLGSEISSQVTEKCFKYLKTSPFRMGFPDHPNPSSRGYLKNVFPNTKTICEKILKELSIKKDIQNKILQDIKNLQAKHFDIPNPSFKGPF